MSTTAYNAYENAQLQFDAVGGPNRNGTYDLGLFQINGRYLNTAFIPAYWHRDEAFVWYNPRHSIYLAVRHIRWLMDRGLCFWEVAAAWNGGLTRVLDGRIPQQVAVYADWVVDAMRDPVTVEQTLRRLRGAGG